MKRRKRCAKRSRRPTGRGWITLLLFLLLGLFVLSIYLGSLEDTDRRGEVQTVSVELTPDAIVPTPESPTLVVWNGCGRDRLAARVSRWLRRQGFDVFETENADRMDYRLTLVVARSRNVEAAQAVADRLREKLGVGLRITQQVEFPRSDVLLILGNDFPDSLPVR